MRKTPINNDACLWLFKQNGGKMPLFLYKYFYPQTKQMEEQWVIDLRNFVCDEPDPSEIIEERNPFAG